MLQTFYPTVTRAALERAFRERPEYFAGGRLFGTQGEKLLLQDGRAFDLAFDAWTVNSRWQALDVTAGGDSAPDPFGLEEGPLVPIDIEGILPPLREDVFAPLAAELARELGVHEIVLEGVGRGLAAVADGASLDADYADTIAPSVAALEGDKLALELLDDAELHQRSDGLTNETRDKQQDFPGDPYVPDAPFVKDPGRPPRDDDAGRPGGKFADQ